MPTLRLRPTLLLILLASTLAAQPQHFNGLVGETPDTSNWPHPAAPLGNPFVRSTAPPSQILARDQQALLGKLVFWEEQVSVDNTMACATCHIPTAGGTDPRVGAVAPNGNKGSFGVIRQHRNAGTGNIDYGFVNPGSPKTDRSVTGLTAPTMIGAYVFNQQFWDMRAGPDFKTEAGGMILNFNDFASLEAQAVGPPVSDVEMAHQGINWASGLIQKKLGSSLPMALVRTSTIPADMMTMVNLGLNYAQLFDQIFSTHPQFGGNAGVTRERFAMAVAHYQRTLIPDQAPLDLGTMDVSMRAGFTLMRIRGCFTCHSATGNPVLLANGRLQNPFDNALSNGQLTDVGFGPVKTQTLRNVALHQRFFSTGLIGPTLDDLITFYEGQPGNLGFGGPLTPQQRIDVRAFLGVALTDPRVAAGLPPFDSPQLHSQTMPFEGNEYGSPTVGPSNLKCEIIANAPPLVPRTNISWFKVGLGNAPAGRNAVLLISNQQANGPILWVGPVITVVTAKPTNLQGFTTLQTPFKLTAATLGIPFFCQWQIDDSGVRAFSNAAKFVPFRF